MQPHARYNIIAQIASGDFASVFRARDKELARDVAIKQIHPHFLADPRQLNLYWDEAQTLASLEHPNVLTIYDIDRERGWLILELMKDTMQTRAAGKPLDLDLVRMGLICGLKALDFLHKSNIIHGDVKPSNLLIDRRNWIKLADFGFAQRATNDQGSLFKGTTRYIAPERVDPERFGPVGPASDLYSLGFAMYELLCGNAFESLFPGFAAFGSDKQIAWMMWHAGPDRHIPKISRVLKGVPEDLAHVIERLVIKNPEERYRDAEEAIRDLKLGMGQQAGMTAAEKAEEEAAALEAESKKRRKKILIVAVCSLVLSLLLVVCLPFLEPPPPPEVKRLPEIHGEIVQIYESPASDDSTPDMTLGKFVIDADRIIIKGPNATDKKHEMVGDQINAPQTLNIRSIDQITINDERLNLKTPEFGMHLFKVGDSVRSEVDLDRTTGQQIQIIHISRPIEDTGEIVDVQPDNNAFVIKSRSFDNDLIKIFLPEAIVIEINDRKRRSQNNNTAGLLKNGDQVQLSHNVFFENGKQTDDRQAQHDSVIRVTRQLTTRGEIQDIDVANRTIIVRTSNGEKRSIRLGDTCEIIVNGRRNIRDRKLSMADLKYRDQVTVDHDNLAQTIDARRTSKGEGSILKITPATRRLRIQLQGSDSRIASFHLPESVAVTLGPEQVTLEDLQPTDMVTLTYDDTDSDNPVISQLTAERRADRKRWAIVLGFNKYDDRTLSPVAHLGPASDNVVDTLIRRYRIPEDQALRLKNVSRTELKSNIKSFLRQIRQGDQLLVYYAGHAYIDRNNQPQLATTDFELLDAANTGLPLAWLIENIETCSADDTVLFLDTCHEGSGADLRQQPSSEEQILLLEKDRSRPALKSLRVITSCGANERGQVDRGEGIFANAIGAAYRGDADTDADRNVTLAEVSDFVRKYLANETNGAQTSRVIMPGKVVPPRLSPDAIEQMKALADQLRKTTINSLEIIQLVDELDGDSAEEPEPKLLCGLAEVRLKNYRDAIMRFEDCGESPIAIQGIIWSNYRSRDYSDAVGQLITLTDIAIQMRGGDERQRREAKRILEWAGRLREYAAAEAPKRDQISTLDAEQIDDAVKSGGRDAETFYNEGRESVQKVAARFDRAIDEAPSNGARSVARNKKMKLSNYADFNLSLLIQQIMRSAQEDG